MTYIANEVAAEVFKKLPRNVKSHASRYAGRDDVVYTNLGVELDMGEGRRREILVSISGMADMIEKVLAGEKAGRSPKIVDALTVVDKALEAKLVEAQEVAEKKAAEEPEVVEEVKPKDTALDDAIKVALETKLPVEEVKEETEEEKKKPGRPAKAK